MTNLTTLQTEWTEHKKRGDELLARMNDAVKADDGMPKFGNRYYYIDSFLDVVDKMWNEEDRNQNRWSIGNVYRTREEAEHAVKVQKAWTKYRRLAKGYKHKMGAANWFNFLVEDEWQVSGATHTNYIGQVYFPTKAEAIAAREAMGPDMDLLRG